MGRRPDGVCGAFARALGGALWHPLTPPLQSASVLTVTDLWQLERNDLPGALAFIAERGGVLPEGYGEALLMLQDDPAALIAAWPVSGSANSSPEAAQ